MKSEFGVQFETYRQILKPSVQEFLDSHSDRDTHQILLQGRDVDGVPPSVLADQLKGRAAAKEKFPDLCGNHSIIYPPGLNLEQSSSSATAALKAELLSRFVTPGVIADVTGGFGVDTYHFSKYFNAVEYIEPNQVLASIAAHNHRTLGATNIRHHVTTAETFLAASAQRLSAIYIDPSRRVNTRRVVSLRDCEPNVLGLQPTIFNRAPVLMIKASPMLDISNSIAELDVVSHVVVVSVQQECRELLFICNDSSRGEPIITTIHVTAWGREVFEFTAPEEKHAQANFGDVGGFLYEPNPSILKSGAFKLVATRFGLAKLDPNTHLYTSNELITGFPGRRFAVRSRLKSDAASVARMLPERKANVIVRNYPLSPDALKKKIKINDGGQYYIIGTTALRTPLLILAERV